MANDHDKGGCQPTVLKAWKMDCYLYPKESITKKEINDALIKMIVQHLQPLSIVEDSGFCNFCKIMNSR